MSLLFNPQGFEVDQHQSGISSPWTLDNAIPAAGLSYSIYYGEPVAISTSTGYIAQITSTSTPVYGIFAGLEYATNNSSSLVQARRYYSANTTFPYTLAAYGSSPAFVRVALYNTPDTLYRVQFSNATPGTVAAPIAALSNPNPYGGQFNLDVATTTVTQLNGAIFPFSGNATVLSNFGQNVTGISYACLSPTQVTVSGTNVGQFILYDQVRQPGNAITDPFPYVRVRINMDVSNAPRIAV